jgi:hypothetical protein
MPAASCAIPTLHEDIIPTDTCATIVLQGTGTSYPSVDCRRRFDRLSDNAIARAEKWSKSETKAFQLHLPQRRPDEPLATTDQIAEINGLALSIAGSGMVNLGSEQAEFLIHELQSVRDLFSEIKIHEYLDRQRSTSRLFVILSMAVIGYALISVSH